MAFKPWSRSLLHSKTTLCLYSSAWPVAARNLCAHQQQSNESAMNAQPWTKDLQSVGRDGGGCTPFGENPVHCSDRCLRERYRKRTQKRPSSCSPCDHEHWVRKSVPIPIQPHNVEGCAGARRTDKSNLVATMECALQHLPARSTVVRWKGLPPWAPCRFAKQTNQTWQGEHSFAGTHKTLPWRLCDRSGTGAQVNKHATFDQERVHK